jgi:hypothetical protein
MEFYATILYEFYEFHEFLGFYEILRSSGPAQNNQRPFDDLCPGQFMTLFQLNLGRSG